MDNHVAFQLQYKYTSTLLPAYSGTAAAEIFNAASVVTDDQPTMRPIMKRPQSTSSPSMDSLAYGTRALTSSRYCATMVAIDKNIAFRLDSAHMIRKTLHLRPYAYIMNINTFMAHMQNCISAAEATARLFPCYLEVHKNAVLLHDIEPRWYPLKQDAAILIVPKNQLRKVYEDIDLNFSAIHREAQIFNDFSETQHKLDKFWMQSLLQHIVSYFKNSWFELTFYQRYILSSIVEENDPHLTVFDQLSWLGYDCLIRSIYNDLVEVYEYNQILNSITGMSSKKSIDDLGVDFGINFTFCKDVIDACDEHFEKCPRLRMSYTKIFYEN